MSESKNACYLAVKRPDPNFQNKWQGSRLLELHTNKKVMAKIEKYRSERLFIKVAAKREITCSVMVDQVHERADGTFLVTFKEIRTDSWVLPGAIKSFAGGFAEGPPPIWIPMN